MTEVKIYKGGIPSVDGYLATSTPIRMEVRLSPRVDRSHEGECLPIITSHLPPSYKQHDREADTLPN